MTIKRTSTSYTPLEETVPLGRGGFGHVRMGKNLVTESPVALKVQPRSTISAREAAILDLITKASIPHCLRYRDSYGQSLEGKEVQVIVTDLVRGKNLYQILKQCEKESENLPSFHDCVTILKSLLESLAGFEKLKLAHFDVKLGNGMYDPKTRQFCLLDVGSAIKLDEMPLKDLCETPGIRSPESLLGNPVEKDGLTCLTDVWSAACIFYELFIGRRLIPSSGCLRGKEQVNFLLQHTAAVIGKMPSPDFLRRCPNAKEYFTEDFLHFKNPDPNIKFFDWRARIRASIDENQLHHKIYSDIVEVLSQMLQYHDTRAHPQQLLDCPLFDDDICFKLELGSFKDQKLPVRMRMMPKVKFDDGSEDSIKLDLNQRLGCMCFHIDRDKAGKYIVILETDGNQICRTVSLEDHGVLNLAPLIEEVFLLSPPKKIRRKLTEELETESPIRPLPENSSQNFQ